MTAGLPVDLLLEGQLEDAVARRLLDDSGLAAGVSYGRRGVDYLLAKVEAFSLSAVAPLLVLADFKDVPGDCPPTAVKSMLPMSGTPRASRVILRLAVPELESWLLADRAGLARFLGVDRNKVPSNPEALTSAKDVLVSLARRSRFRRVRDFLVPEVGTSARQGPAYVTELSRFVRDAWDLDAATVASLSLNGCRRALMKLAEKS